MTNRPLPDCWVKDCKRKAQSHAILICRPHEREMHSFVREEGKKEDKKIQDAKVIPISRKRKKKPRKFF